MAKCLEGSTVVERLRVPRGWRQRPLVVKLSVVCVDPTGRRWNTLMGDRVSSCLEPSCVLTLHRWHAYAMLSVDYSCSAQSSDLTWPDMLYIVVTLGSSPWVSVLVHNDRRRFCIISIILLKSSKIEKIGVEGVINQKQSTFDFFLIELFDNQWYIR